MNVDTCNKLAKAHLEHYEGEIRSSVQEIHVLTILEPQPVAPNAKSSEQNEPSGSAHKGNRSPAPKKGTFRTFLQKINPARLFNSRTRDLSKTSKEPSKNITTDQSSQIVPLSSFDETAVAQQLEAQKQRAQAFQKNATLMSKLRWGHEDRQSFVESLDMIVNDVKELRLLIEDFIQLCKGLEGVKRGREYPQRAPERPPMDYFVKASPSSSSYDSDESRRSRHGRVKKLQPISTSIFQCQETFHQVHSDICRLLPEPQSDVLYVKIYFDYHRTWEEFRPYQGVNVRDDSLVFMFQVQDSTSGLKSRLVVVDTPVLQPTDREGFESENDLRRLLSQRLIKRPMLQDSFDFEEFGIEPNELPFVCIGSLKAEFPRTPRAPDKLLNLLGPSKDLDDVLIVGWKHNLVASSDKAYRVSSRDSKSMLIP
jgi:hypothetical protein